MGVLSLLFLSSSVVVITSAKLHLGRCSHICQTKRKHGWSQNAQTWAVTAVFAHLSVGGTWETSCPPQSLTHKVVALCPQAVSSGTWLSHPAFCPSYHHFCRVNSSHQSFLPSKGVGKFEGRERALSMV